MASVFFRDSSYQGRASFRRRATAFLVAAAANILLVLMLLRLASVPAAVQPPRNPVLINLLPEPTLASTREKKATQQKRAGQKTPPHPTPPRKEPATPPPAAVAGPLKMIIVSRDVFRSSDISKLPQHPADETKSATTADAAGSEGDSSTDGPGTGPHGEPLYNAEWFREPTNTELSFYLRSRPPPPDGGWALIACRTAARYRVEDCIEIGDSPPGSGLARAMREAAWQFLVRPPRVGGHSMVGAWVRIRVDFTSKPER